MQLLCAAVTLAKASGDLEEQVDSEVEGSSPHERQRSDLSGTVINSPAARLL